jgi:hypothetical protein
MPRHSAPFYGAMVNRFITAFEASRTDYLPPLQF